MRDMAYDPPGDDPFGTGAHLETERTSLAAILGFVFSLGGCCFGVTALLGLPLSVFALLTIGKSGGRLGGRGLAITGLILSVLNLAAWGSCLGGGVGMVNMLDRQVFVPVESVFEQAEAGDFDAARAGLASPASGVSDAEMAAFLDAYRSTLGDYRDRPRGFGGYVGSMSDWGPWSSVLSNPGQNVVPALFTFERGDALVLIYIDQSTGQPSSIAVYDAALNEYTLPMQPGWETADGGGQDPSSEDPATGDPVDPGLDDPEEP